MIAVAVLAVSIIFTPAPEPPPLPEGFVCEPGTVPGSLNEVGLPTSCVGDQANPGEDPIFTAEPAPVGPVVIVEDDPEDDPEGDSDGAEPPAVGDDVEPEPLPEGFTCPPDTSPGWLNQDGLPTGCVGDHPNPGEDEAVEPLPEPLPLDPLPVTEHPSTPIAPVDQLAETGPADLAPLAAGGLLALLGGLLTRIGRRSA